MVAIAPGIPLAQRVVPSSGSTAISTFGPLLLPTFSPIKSIGALSRSPSPITTVPSIGILLSSRRMASTAAWSAAILLPWPRKRAAETAARSVTRTISSVRIRSSSCCGGTATISGIPQLSSTSQWRISRQTLVRVTSHSNSQQQPIPPGKALCSRIWGGNAVPPQPRETPKKRFFRRSNGLPRGRHCQAKSICGIVQLMTAILDDGPQKPLRSRLVTRGGTGFAVGMALSDFSTGLAMWPLWMRLGWNDILQRYRRSMLGPFWLTASMAIMVIALGVLYAELFNTPIHDFLPYLCVGLLVWNLMSSFLIEGGTLFTGAESYIKQIRLPYASYVFRASWSKLIIFGHNFIIYFGVLLYFEIWPGAVALLALPGLLLVLVNGAAATLCIGMVSARFRDVPQLINSVVQIVFFVTPIMWRPELLRNRTFIAVFNAFYHLLEIVRAPLLGTLPSAKSYIAVLLITLVNVVIVGAFFARFRSRISYWV